MGEGWYTAKIALFSLFAFIGLATITFCLNYFKVYLICEAKLAVRIGKRDSGVAMNAIGSLSRSLAYTFMGVTYQHKSYINLCKKLPGNQTLQTYKQ